MCRCSQKDVQQLKSILCTPSFNPDIRRSAADQLLSLTACHRFQQLLTEPAVLYDLLDQLTGNMHILTGFNNVVGSARESASHGYASTDMQQLLIGDVQLPTACLQLLLALVQHCEETRELLLKDPDR